MADSKMGDWERQTDAAHAAKRKAKAKAKAKRFRGSHAYVENLNFTVWWVAPNRIVVGSGDARFTRPDGSKPGLWFDAYSDRGSPNNFNRAAGYLRSQGKRAPATVPES